MISKRDTKSEARLNTLSLTYMVEFCGLQLNYNKQTVYVFYNLSKSLAQLPIFTISIWSIFRPPMINFEV